MTIANDNRLPWEEAGDIAAAVDELDRIRHYGEPAIKAHVALLGERFRDLVRRFDSAGTFSATYIEILANEMTTSVVRQVLERAQDDRARVRAQLAERGLLPDGQP